MALVEQSLNIVNELKNRLIATDQDRQIHKIILYGSRAQGTAKPDSDYDLLIVKKDPVSKREEMNRLRREMHTLPCALDIWVMGKQEFEETRNVIGGLAYPANKYGQVIYENA